MKKKNYMYIYIYILLSFFSTSSAMAEEMGPVKMFIVAVKKNPISIHQLGKM